MFADLQNKYIDLYFFFVIFQLNFYFAQYGLLQSKLCTMIDVQTNSITADFIFAGFQRVEYIESHSTGAGTTSTGQYILTGFIPNNQTKVEFKIGNWTNTGTSSNEFFGSDRQWNNGGGFSLLAGYYSFNTGVTFSHNLNDGNIHTGEFSQSGLYKDGVKLVTPATYSFTGVNMCLFALNRNGTISEHGSLRLYYFKVYDNGTLVRDFYPVYRKSDNVIGLLDIVNKVFYSNQGTGSFTKGGNI